VRYALRLSDEELRKFKKRAFYQHLTLPAWVRKCCHFYIETGFNHSVKLRNQRKNEQLQRISSLIWGVVAKRFEEYGEIE